MQTTLTPLSEILPYPGNAKKHPDKQVKQIAASIKAFGFNQPLVLDKSNTIIVGHGRFYAAQLLGMEEVPTITVDLDDESAKAYRLADNKLNESDWDMELVIEELKTLSLELIDLSGFDQNLVIETKEDKPNLGGIGVPRTKQGDVYDLGRHRLICEDSMLPGTYEVLLGNERPRLVFTDPPYSIDYESAEYRRDHKSYQSERFGGTGGKIFNDDKTPEEAQAFYTRVLERLYAFTSDDVTIYWWFANRLSDVNISAFREADWHLSQIVIWLKNSLIYSPSQLFHRIYEPCMVGWKEGKSHYQNLTFTQYTELWTLDKATFAEHLDLWYEKRDNTNQYIHPTQKPVRLAERAIKRSSAINDLVLDAFGGSGSTLMACEQLDRSARLIELDPKYCDAIVSRYVKHVENNEIIKNGQPYSW